MVKLPEGFYLIPELAWKPRLMSFTDDIRLKSVSGTKLIEDDYVMLTGKKKSLSE